MQALNIFLTLLVIISIIGLILSIKQVIKNQKKLNNLK